MSERPGDRIIDAPEQSAGADAGEGYATPEIEGVEGVLKVRPEDFVVDEVPLYEPCGEGEHLYLLVEKVGATTSRAVEIIRRALRVPEKMIGVAGLKDRHAVTRQYISVHDPGARISEDEAESIATDQVRVVFAQRHGNKLKRGHLRANRFRIRIREVGPAAAPRALRTLRALEKLGAPNLHGEQRYGSRRNNHLIGRAVILGDFGEALRLLLGCATPGDEDRNDSDARVAFEAGRYEEAVNIHPPTAQSERRALGALRRGEGEERAIRAVSRLQREFWIAAFQSAVFDDVLIDRMRRGGLAALTIGDLAWKHDNGAVFAVTERESTDELRSRLDRLEISPSGPLWGPKMTRAGGEIDEREVGWLRRAGVRLEDLESYARWSGDRKLGSRRAMRVPVRETDVEAGVDEHGEYVQCSFELPSGAFATVVMEEVMKRNPPGGERAHW